jgi:hypothetical protein
MHAAEGGSYCISYAEGALVPYGVRTLRLRWLCIMHRRKLAYGVQRNKLFHDVEDEKQ